MVVDFDVFGDLVCFVGWCCCVVGDCCFFGCVVDCFGLFGW